MSKNHKDDLGIRAALWEIQKQSPFCHMVEYRQDATNAHKPEWCPPEAALAWAIYERAVFDANGFLINDGTWKSRSEAYQSSAKEAATTGQIDTAHGKKNLLELLGIDPEWALQMINKVNGRYNEMLAEGCLP